jgi:hypothetical protein
VKEHSVKERSVKEHSVKEHSVKEHSVEEHSVKEHSVKERSVKEHSVKEHSVKEHSVKEHSVKEQCEGTQCEGSGCATRRDAETKRMCVPVMRKGLTKKKDARVQRAKPLGHHVQKTSLLDTQNLGSMNPKQSLRSLVWRCEMRRLRQPSSEQPEKERHKA